MDLQTHWEMPNPGVREASAMTCDEWTRDPLRTVKLAAKEFQAIQVRPHDRDKIRCLVESPISSHGIGEDEDAWETHAFSGPIVAEGDEIVFVIDMPAGDLTTFRSVSDRARRFVLMARCPANDCAPENHGLAPVWVNGRYKQARRIQTVIGRLLRGETLAVMDRACFHRIQACPYFGAEGFEQWCTRQFPEILQPLRQWGLSQWAAIRVRIEEGGMAECKRLQNVRSENFKNYVQLPRHPRSTSKSSGSNCQITSIHRD